MDVVPDITEQSWRSAAYHYGAPDAPEYENVEDEWDVHADDWEEW